VAELGNDSIGVIDVKSRKVVRTISGFNQPQGVLHVPATDEIYVADAGDGALHILRATDLSSVKRIELGRDADNVRVDPARHQVTVCSGAAFAFIDPASHTKRAEVALPGHPESFQFDAAGTRIFVNIPEAEEIAIVDPASRKILGSWRQADGANFAMALD